MVWEKLSRTELVRLAVLLIYLPFSLYFDWRYFNFSEKSSYLLYTISKLVQLFLLYLFLGQVLNALWKKWIGGKFRLALLVFAVLFVGLLLLQPSDWVEVNEYKIYQYALMLKVHPTRGLLVAVLCVVGLMFFFHPVMITELQLVLGAWIYANLIQQCRAVTGRGARLILLLLFSPATLYYLYQPMRAFLFGILLIIFLRRYLMLWSRQGDDNFQRDVLQLSLLVAGIIYIRTEIKFLLIFYPIMLAVLFVRRRLALIRQIVAVILMMGLALIGCMACRKSYARGDSPVTLGYAILVYTILRDPKFDRETHREKLESIDHVYAPDEIISKTNRAYTLAGPRSGYTKQKMDRFLQNSTKLILTYPIDFLRCRWNELVASVGLNEEAEYIQTAENVMGRHVKDWDVGDLTQRAKPLNPILRNKVSRLLGGQFTMFGISMNFVFWTFWAPIVITTELFLVSLWGKRLDFVFVLFALLIELAGVVLTAPVKYAIYYSANYLREWYFLYLYYILARTDQVIYTGNGQRD